jgi:hypothetical protein
MTHVTFPLTRNGAVRDFVFGTSNQQSSREIAVFGEPTWHIIIVEAARDGITGVRYGAARHANIATASVLAVLSAARRLGVSAKDLPTVR